MKSRRKSVAEKWRVIESEGSILEKDGLVSFLHSSELFV